MILAAGRGERMRPLTDRLPKPLLEAGGHRLIEYHLAALAQHGIPEVVVNLSSLGERIPSRSATAAVTASRFATVPRVPSPWAPAEARSRRCRCSARNRSWSSTAMSGRTCGLDALRRPAGSLAHLVLVPNPAHHPAGDLGFGLTYAGVSVLDPRLFDGCSPGAFPLKPLLERAQRAGRLTSQRHAGAWTDVGTPERLAALDAELRLGKLRHPVLASPVG